MRLIDIGRMRAADPDGSLQGGLNFTLKSNFQSDRILAEFSKPSLVFSEALPRRTFRDPRCRPEIP